MSVRTKTTPYGSSLSHLLTPGSRRSGAAVEATVSSFGTKSLMAIHLPSLPCCPARNTKPPDEIAKDQGQTSDDQDTDHHLSVLRQRDNDGQVLAEISRGEHPNHDPERSSNRIEQRETPPGHSQHSRQDTV